MHDDSYYRHQWHYDLQQLELTSARKRGMEHKFLKELDPGAALHALDRYYVVNGMRLYLYLLGLAGIYDIPPDDSSLNQIEKFAGQYVNKGDPVIDFFFNIFRLMRTPEEPCFYELKARFLQKDRSIPSHLMRDACVAMENYCIKKIREGEEKYTGEVMQIYRLEVENELYLQNGKMEPVYYYNIAIRGSESPEIEWAEHFVENYKQYLPDEIREDSYNYAQAHILFARKKYREALRLALSCNIQFFVGKITIKNLVARIHYELSMPDELHLDLDAYRHHLKDEKISEDRRHFFQAFTTFMRHLIELKTDYSHEKWLHLSSQIEAQKAAPARRWFLEKMKELERH